MTRWAARADARRATRGTASTASRVLKLTMMMSSAGGVIAAPAASSSAARTVAAVRGHEYNASRRRPPRHASGAGRLVGQQVDQRVGDRAAARRDESRGRAVDLARDGVSSSTDGTPCASASSGVIAKPS